MVTIRLGSMPLRSGGVSNIEARLSVGCGDELGDEDGDGVARPGTALGLDVVALVPLPRRALTAASPASGSRTAAPINRAQSRAVLRRRWA